MSAAGRTWERRGDRIVVVLPRGADVLGGIVAAAAEAGATGAFTGIGAIESPRLAWFDRDARTYREWTLDGVWEIASLTGNLAVLDGAPRIHAHAVVSGPDLETRAGHLAGGTVGVTCEVVLAAWDDPLVRRVDPAAGLPLIALGGS